MSVKSVGFVFVVACLLATYIQAQQPAAEPKAIILTAQNISRNCFGCICEAASGCDTTAGCDGEVCGPFRITWGYWADAGKPTLNSEPSNADKAFERCVNDAFCASRAVQGYMNQFAKDCNGDGVINCDDYARIHRLGGYGCSGPIDAKYNNAYINCLAEFRP